MVDGFKEGFILPFKGLECPFTGKNSLSALHNPEALDLKLQKELSVYRVAGPFDEPPLPNFKASPLSLRPKPGGFRLLHNLSYPYDESSVNGGFDKADTTVKYATVSDAIELILLTGQKCYLAKSDIANAFRVIPLHPTMYHLTGFTWKGKYYSDLALPMGAAPSCRLYEEFTDSLVWILKNKFGVTGVCKYVDDFLFIGSSWQACNEALQAFLRLAKQIGLPIAPDKTVPPTTCLTFLGIQLDTLNMQASLPIEKIKHYHKSICDHISSTKITLQDLRTLIGQLQFATSIVTPGRPFLRRLIDLTIGKTRPYHKIDMNKEVKADLTTWAHFLQHYNGKHFMMFRSFVSSPDLKLCSDASHWGLGGRFGSKWIQCRFPDHWKTLHITVLELFPVYILLSMFGHQLANSHVQYLCDNKAVTDILNKLTSKNKHVMSIVRPLVLVLLKFNIRLSGRHIPGKTNQPCDLLSRTSLSQIPQSVLQDYGLEPCPVPIPQHLLPSTFKL